jgi:D-proline reductase (dithiol) PrdB
MTSALDITLAVKPPRTVFLNFPLGHQTGKPHQRESQLQIVRDAMAAFVTIDRPGTIVELPYVWDPNDRGWEETDYTGDFLPPRPPKEDADLIEAERRSRFAGRSDE